jgi:hypothetical protein
VRAIPSQAYADGADLDPGSALGFGETRDATLALLTLTVLSGSRFQRRGRANRICRLHLFKDEAVRLPTEDDEGDSSRCTIRSTSYEGG